MVRKFNRMPAILAATLLVLGLVIGAAAVRLTRSSQTVKIVTTQVVLKGQTWDYLALYSPLLYPPSSESPGDSFAVVNSDTSWTSSGKAYPELFVSPGQTKTYQVRLFIDPNTLPLNGQLLTIDGLGLGVHFNSSSISGSAGGGALTMTISLASNFSSGPSTFQIPVIFSSSDRIQPVEFGPIYIVSGLPGQNTTETLQWGQPTMSFEDDEGRGYGVDLSYLLKDTSVLAHSPVCAGLDPNGELVVTNNSTTGLYCPTAYYEGTVALALKEGQSTNFTIQLRLDTQLGVQIGFLDQEVPASPFFSIVFSPSEVTLQPGGKADVVVTVHGLRPGSGDTSIVVSASTLEGETVGAGIVYNFFLTVVVTE